MKHRIKRRLYQLATLGLLALPFLTAPYEAEAVAPSISLSSKYNSITNDVTITITSAGKIEMTDGTIHAGKTTTYTVSQNGVYSFTSITDEGKKHGSILIDQINSEKYVVSDPNIKLKLTFQDALSGISQMRFRNETTGTWSAWQNVTTPNNKGTQSVDWKFDTSKEGERMIYAQFKDKAGNITDGEPYDSIVYDVSGPSFKPTRKKYYTNNPNIQVYIEDIKDTYSAPKYVYVAVGNAGYTQYPTKNHNWKTGVAYTIPTSERTSGKKPVKIYMEDDLGNTSPVQQYEIYYDITKPSGAVTVKNNDNTNLSTQWFYNNETNKEESILLAKEQNIKVDLNLNDAHSGISRNMDGIAEVIVREKLVNGSYKTRTYTDIPTTGKMTVPWTLDYGLNKQLDIIVKDNAGNTATAFSQAFRLSNLQLVHFKILDIVNPKSDFEGGDVYSTTDDPEAVVAGGNVTIEMAYSLISTKDPVELKGNVEVLFTRPADDTGAPVYAGRIDIGLKNKNIKRDQAYPYFVETFKVPEDAPPETIVTVQGWLTAEFEDGSELTINFPHKNRNVKQQIGVVNGDIQNDVKFNIVR